VVQQYRFLADYLRQLSDRLTNRREQIYLHFKPEIQISTVGKELANGDRCQAFAGVGGRYYILLCDGMGTGMGAAQEGQTALNMLRQMLTAGFPAEYALQSVNSLCCLRGRAGAVTVDLAELQLDTGRATLYKWGAAPSVLLRSTGAEKIGTVGPPPGLDLENTRETVDRLSLRRGEALILMSDGVAVEEVLRSARIGPGEPLGEFAAKLLAACSEEGSDDATVAAIRLHPTSLST
jgi:stage II sporulation protein E